MTFYTGGSERVRITTGGNVGIGTTTTDYRLNVATSGILGFSLNTNTSTVGGPQIDLYDSGRAQETVISSTDGTTVGTYIASYTNHPLLFGTYAGSTPTAKMTILPGGNVGIGTTSPSELVDAYKSFNGDVVCQISNPNAGTSAAAQFFASNGTNRTQFFHTGTSYTGPGVLTSAAGLGGLYNATVQGLAFLAANASGTIKFATGTGNDERMRITSGGSLLIGDTTQGYSPTSQGYLLGVKSNTTQAFISIAKSGQTLDTNGMIVGLDSTAGYIYLRENIDLAFGTNNTTQVTIKNNGNVGIGTTSPAQKLEVAGKIRLTDDIQLWSANPTILWESGALRFYNNSTATERMRITAAGDVGIGTTSPAFPLHVARSSGDSVIVADSGAAYNSQFRFQEAGALTAAITFVSSDDSLRFYNGGDRFTILSNGNVGIGTTSPSYKLHVEGNTSGISIYASHDIAAFSDITVKKEVKKIENAIEKVKELNGYTYVRTDDETGTRRAGVIAQEVQKVLPEVVSANPDGTLNVAYSNMIALLIEGMKEQQATIERLENRIKMLEKCARQLLG
jgi:hypothetical protein